MVPEECGVFLGMMIPIVPNTPPSLTMPKRLNFDVVTLCMHSTMLISLKFDNNKINMILCVLSKIPPVRTGDQSTGPPLGHQGLSPARALNTP